MNKWIEEEAGKYYAIVKDDGNTYESFIAGAQAVLAKVKEIVGSIDSVCGCGARLCEINHGAEEFKEKLLEKLNADL